MAKCDFNKVAKQLYRNHTSAWMLPCKFAAYFQNTFSQEHLRVFASVFSQLTERLAKKSIKIPNRNADDDSPQQCMTCQSHVLPRDHCFFIGSYI